MTPSPCSFCGEGVQLPDPRPLIELAGGAYRWRWHCDECGTTFVSGSWWPLWGMWVDLRNEEQGARHLAELVHVIEHMHDRCKPARVEPAAI